MKNLTAISLLLCFLSALSLKSQQVLSTSGTTFQNQSCTVSFTVGETIIGNLQNSTCLVSQGFQQSWQNNVGISENNDGEESLFYPNPASDFLHFNGLLSQRNVRIAIMDIRGNSVLSANVYQNQTLDIQMLPKGFYIIQINIGESRFIEKLIID